MFSLISDLPEYTIGIKASGEIRVEDYKKVLWPALKKAAEEWKGINMLFVMETDFSHFSLGAWLEDIKLNAKYFFKWNKVAMVSNKQTLDTITKVFDLIAPAEAKAFSLTQLDEATEWVSSP